MDERTDGRMNEQAQPAAGPARQTLRSRLAALAEDVRFQRAIIVLIVVNAITLGLETSPSIMASAGSVLVALDHAVLAMFVAELAIRIGAYGRSFFRDPWSLFDFVVVALALAPSTENFSVLRALRVLRVLRLVTAVPQMRRVVGGLLAALPGLGSVVAILSLVFYVAGVMATQLFGDEFPQWFGTLGGSLYSLFQIMTLESWSMGIVRPVMETYPYAWAFFVPFILIATFTMLNLFIAVVVNAMQSYHDMEAAHMEETRSEHAELLTEIRALRADLKALRAERGED